MKRTITILNIQACRTMLRSTLGSIQPIAGAGRSLLVALALLAAIAPTSLATEKSPTQPPQILAAQPIEKAEKRDDPADQPMPAESVKSADEPFWVPAARLSTDAPQRIQINNKTGVPLEYLITTHTNFRTLGAGKAVTLTDFSTPIFLNINAQESNYLVMYKVAVNEKTNTLMVTVSLTNGQDNRTLNLDETGAVYLY